MPSLERYNLNTLQDNSTILFEVGSILESRRKFGAVVMCEVTADGQGKYRDTMGFITLQPTEPFLVLDFVEDMVEASLPPNEPNQHPVTKRFFFSNRNRRGALNFVNAYNGHCTITNDITLQILLQGEKMFWAPNYWVNAYLRKML